MLEDVEWVENVRRFQFKDIYALRMAVETARERTYDL